MRQKILVLVLCFQVGMADSFSQNIAIENMKHNIVYPYLDNPMNIIVEGISCDEIFVSTNNGEIRSNGNCEYIFLPQKIGIASIFIHKIEKGDTIQIKERKYRVKRWPKPTARIGRVNSGKIELEKFKVQSGVRVRIENFDMEAYARVISFQLQIIRGKDWMGAAINLGGRFEEKTKKLMLTVERGDRVIVDKIVVMMPGSKEKIELDDIDVVVK